MSTPTPIQLISGGFIAFAIGIAAIIYMARHKILGLDKMLLWQGLTPRIHVNANNPKLLERILKDISKLTFEERIMVVQRVFGKDIKVLMGHDRKGRSWIDAAFPYDYQNMSQSLMEEKE